MAIINRMTTLHARNSNLRVLYIYILYNEWLGMTREDGTPRIFPFEANSLENKGRFLRSDYSLQGLQSCNQSEISCKWFFPSRNSLEVKARSLRNEFPLQYPPLKTEISLFKVHILECTQISYESWVKHFFVFYLDFYLPKLADIVKYPPKACWHGQEVMLH